MAISAYSEANNYDLDVSMGSVDLIGKVMTATQQRYDSNKAEIDAYLQQYQNIDLIRPEDRERLFNRLNNLTNMVNESGGVDYSDPNLKGAIQQHIGQALDSYTFDQIGETKKIRKFNQEMEARKMKKDGGYNDLNYAYALDKAGVQSYMSGETDSIGNLQYTNFKNLAEEASTKLSKWAKDFGIKTVVEEKTGQVYYETKTKKILSHEDISDFIGTQLRNDPEAVKQMQINAWGKFRGQTDEQIKTYYKSGLDSQINMNNDLIERNSTILKTIPEGHPEREGFEARLNGMKGKVMELTNLRNSENFNREAIEYELTSSQFINDLARTHTKDDVTKITKSDLPHRVASRDLSNQIKLEKLRLQEEAKKTEGQLDVATVTNPIDVEAEGKESDWEIADNKLIEKTAQFRELARMNPEYATKTDDELDTIMLTLGEKANDQRFVGSAPVANSDMMKIASEVYSVASTKKYMENTIFERFNAMNTSFYNDIVEGRDNITLGNLAITMPTVADNARKGIKYEDLSKSDQAKVMYELSSSARQDVGGAEDITGSGKKPIDIYLEQLEKHNPGISQGQERKSLVGGLAEGLYERGTALALGARGLFRAGTGLITGEPTKGVQNLGRDIGRARQAYQRGVQATNAGDAGMRAWLAPDSNINAIGAHQAGTDAGINLADRYRGLSNAISADVSARMKENMENVKEETSAIINPKASKTEKAVFEQARSYASNAGILTDGNSVMKFSYDGGANIKVEIPITKDTKGNTKTGGEFDIAFHQAPDAIKALTRKEQGSYAYSPKNPNSRVKEVVMAYQVPSNGDALTDMVKNFSNRGNLLFSDGNMEYATNNFIKDRAWYEEYSDLSKEDTDKILDATYKVVPNHKPGGGFTYEIKQGGLETGRDGVSVTKSSTIPNMKVFDTEMFEIFVPEAIHAYLLNKLTETKK